jgi:hypothetical protein
MGKIVGAATAMIVLFCLAGIQMGFSDAENKEDLESCYQAHIDDCIARCTTKMQLRNSRSSALRHAALLASMKKTFLVQYRDALVLRMSENNIPAKRHSMDNYLDRMFYGLFRPTLASYRY